MAVVLALTATGQYRLYRDHAGAPLGLLSWAWVSAWTLNRLRPDPLLPLHPCEWNEGEQLYFRDIAISPVCADALAKDLAGGVFGAQPWCFVGLRKSQNQGVALTRLEASQRPGFAAWLRARASATAGTQGAPA